MRFTESEIQWATRLRGAGLTWEPQPGHYVFDIDGVIKAGSPFQAGVHLIASANAMEQTVGGPEALRERFVWLPTWEDARAWLADRGVDGARVLAAVARAAGNGTSDREALYALMLEVLEGQEEERS